MMQPNFGDNSQPSYENAYAASGYTQGGMRNVNQYNEPANNQGFGQTQAYGQQAYGQPYGQQQNFGFQSFEQQQGYGQATASQAYAPRDVPFGTKVAKFMSSLGMKSLPSSASKVFSLSTVEIFTYLLGFITIIAGYNLLSNGGAGTVVPLAAAIQFMGFLMVLVKAKSSRSVAGISAQTLHIWMVGIFCRLSVNMIILWSDHADSYLPSDATCDWAYQMLELGSGLSIAALLYEIHVVHKQPIAECKMSPVLIVACLILAVIVHPKLNSCWSNMRFAAGQYLEGIAMIPQIVQMAKEGGKVEALTSHYIACSFTASAMMFSWWWGVQDILKTDEYPSTIPARTILLFSTTSVLLLADFMYQYVKAAVKNAALVLPSIDV